MRIFNQKTRTNLLASCMVLATCFFTSACSNGSSVENNSNSSTAVQVKTQAQPKTENENLYSYASHLNLSNEELENLLTVTKEGNEYKLIPVTSNSKEYEDFWCDLVTTNEDYMQTFFLNRKLPSKSRALSQFRSKLKSMWNSRKADTLFFITTLNGEYCGTVESAGLSTEDGIIGYITKQEYAGKGIASTSLEMFVNLIKHLNSTGFYNVKTLSLWIFDDNAASISVAKKNGFVFAEADPENKRSRYSLEIK